MDLVERWIRHEKLVNDGEDLSRFALRADGALVIFDEDGYFLVVKAEGAHGPDTLWLQSDTGEREAVYMEPAWTWGYFDHFFEMFHRQG